MIKKWSIRYPAVGGEEERRAYVYLPTMYDADPGRRYPVLYMFDGQNVFFDEDATYGKSWGVADYLDYTDTPLIVAAVECNAGANNERLVEYSPYRFDDKQYGHFDGKGKDTLNWFVHEFKPFIDANYRTQPDRAHTFIGGSSMGGLMSLYALLQYSDVFGRAAALSPSLWVAPEALTALVGRCKLAPGTVLYMDYGSREMGNHDGMRKGFGEMCSRIFARGINLTARVVPGGNHSEASWEKQLPFVFHTLLYERHLRHRISLKDPALFPYTVIRNHPESRQSLRPQPIKYPCVQHRYRCSADRFGQGIAGVYQCMNAQRSLRSL